MSVVFGFNVHFGKTDFPDISDRPKIRYPYPCESNILGEVSMKKQHFSVNL